MRADPDRVGWRSAPIAIFALALLILFVGVLVSVQFNAAYQRSRVEQSQGFADVLAASAAAAVDFDDPQAAQQSASAYRVNQQIRLIGIYRRDGTLVAGYDRSGADVPATLGALSANRGNVIRVQSPISQAGQAIGTVAIDVDKDMRSRTAARYIILFGMFLLTALVVASVGFAQAQLRRANRELGKRAEALAQSNELLEEQIEERAKAEDQLRQSQKMQALGQLTGGIAHDFNNLLTVIQGSADMLSPARTGRRQAGALCPGDRPGGGHAASLTSQLLAFARRQPLKPEHLDVNFLLGDMRDMIDRTLGERITVVTDFCETQCRIEVDRGQLQSAILNIVSNARDAMPDGGVLTLRTAHHRCGDDGRRMVARRSR